MTLLNFKRAKRKFAFLTVVNLDFFPSMGCKKGEFEASGFIIIFTLTQSCVFSAKKSHQFQFGRKIVFSILCPSIERILAIGFLNGILVSLLSSSVMLLLHSHLQLLLPDRHSQSLWRFFLPKDLYLAFLGRMVLMARNISLVIR